jgi:hypothetical protein
LKLPEPIILRVNDLIVFAALDTGAKRDQLERINRITLKKRYYLRCLRDYLHLFKGLDDGVLSHHFTGGLSEPYLYNSAYKEEDPFFRKSQEEESKESPQKPGALT